MRVSARTRRVRLVMTAAGLEVLIPQGFDRSRIPGLIDSKREWIEKNRRRFELGGRHLGLDAARLPERIVLPAVEEEWLVEYRPRAVGGRSAATARVGRGCRLVVTGDPADYDACKQAIRRWLTRRARQELEPRLEELARQHGLRYERVSIRQQQSRWGSCSRRGRISLNAKLLFLPPTAVDYVLLHELCHTLEMNHSPRFWALVERLDPGYVAHRRLVRTVAKKMPTWLEHEPDEGAM